MVNPFIRLHEVYLTRQEYAWDFVTRCLLKSNLSCTYTGKKWSVINYVCNMENHHDIY